MAMSWILQKANHGKYLIRPKLDPCIGIDQSQCIFFHPTTAVEINESGILAFLTSKETSIGDTLFEESGETLISAK